MGWDRVTSGRRGPILVTPPPRHDCFTRRVLHDLHLAGCREGLHECLKRARVGGIANDVERVRPIDHGLAMDRDSVLADVLDGCASNMAPIVGSRAGQRSASWWWRTTNSGMDFLRRGFVRSNHTAAEIGGGAL
jgi:hypothetical protein